MHLTGMRGMPRRVFTYPEGLGFDALNMTSTIGAFVLGAGVAVIFWDIVRPKGKEPYATRNPWNAGTLEWLQDMPGENWGVRSIPEIDSRYPLWEQKNFVRDVDEGRFYLPDAEEGKRETIVTSVIDGKPMQCLRLPGPSFLPMLSAVTIGGFFIFGTYHLWIPAVACLPLGLAVICYWIWTGTALHPEKAQKDVGLGLTLPIYASGSASVGWWGVFITMLADMTAYVCLVFGYFFFWTLHDDFPPDLSVGPGLFWPVLAGTLGIGAWLLMLVARRANRSDAAALFYASVAGSVLLAKGSAAALVAGPWTFNMDPTAHVYQAVVWVLVAWTVAHLGVGVIMQVFCLVSRWRGRMTAQHDADITNVTLYWHFALLTVVVTVAVIAGFPLVA
jgi:cytochrome c oxidase subunit I+III